MCKKGHTPWNKGLTKETSEILCQTGKKISISCKGRPGWSKGLKLGKIPHKENCKCPWCDAKRGNNHAKKPEVREKIRQSKLGDKNPMKRPEVREKMLATKIKNGTFEIAGKKISKTRKEKWKNGEIKQHEMTTEERKKSSIRMKENNPMYNPETVKKAKNHPNRIKYYEKGGGLVLYWKKEGTREKQRQKMLLNNPMKNPEIVKKSIEKNLKLNYTKNKTETFIDDIIQEYFPNKWKYTGDGQTFIGGRVPDWISKDDSKKTIEYASTYWHQIRVNKPLDNYVQERTIHFGKYGFKVLFLFDNDLDEDKIKQKVENFIGE